jgi:hypothetical protein
MGRGRDRVIVRRRAARPAGTNWIPWVLVIGLLVIGGIVIWMLMTGDDPDVDAGLVAVPLAGRTLFQTASAVTRRMER